MSSDELDPKLEAATKEFIGISELISRAIVSEARGSIRYKKSIAISPHWPARLKHPLSEQITAHLAADHKLRGPLRSTVFPNEAAALSWYLQDFLSAYNVTVGNFVPHGAVFLDRRTQRTVVKKILDALLLESELEMHKRAEIPGIDLKRAAGFIRYGHGHKVPVPRIVYWFQQELPWDAIVTEVRYGGIPPGYPMDEGPELGLHHSIDSDLGLDLARIATWMETGRWPLDANPGEIIATISEHGEKPSTRFAIPLVELFWLFGRTPEMGAHRGELGDWLSFQFQNLADDAIMHPPEFESDLALSAPAASQPEPAAAPENHSAESEKESGSSAAVETSSSTVESSTKEKTETTDENPSDRAENSRSDPSANWGPDEWKRAETAASYCEELNRLKTIAVGDTNEEKLRKEHPEMTIWAHMESGVSPLKREALFPRLRAARAQEIFEFVGLFFGVSAVTVKRWKLACDKRKAPSLPDPS
jgi:hypothetical protein